MALSFFKGMRRRVIFLIVVAAVVLFPVAILLGMRMVWKMNSERTVNVAYVDKTDDSEERLAHNAFFWVLNNQRIKKPNGEFYQKGTDYWGLFAEANNKYRFADFDALSVAQQDSLAERLDMLMLADTYGIYDLNAGPEMQRLIYGGLSEGDMALFRQMKRQGKTIVAEFNILQAPTPRNIRYQFQQEAGIEWSGWTGKYFDSLDPEKGQLPGWVFEAYQRNNQKQWEYKDAGIILVHENGQLLVLEDNEELLEPIPQIKTFGYGMEQLGLPRVQEFPYWFDIMTFDNSINHAVSAYQLELTEKGRTKLNSLGIPDRFPAVIMHGTEDYAFYYFCGDFSSKPVSMSTKKFKGIECFSSLLKGRQGQFGEDQFFYRFYLPLMSQLLKESVQ